MCGIFGVYSSSLVVKSILNGLSKLEYRGYDSSGISILDEKRKIHTLRAKGKIEKLKEKLKKYLSTDILELVTLDGQLTEYPLLQMHILIRQTMYQ